MIWALLLGFTVLTALFIAWPMRAARQAQLTRAGEELATHKRALDDIERDLEAGRLAPEEADSLRVEVQRRMLRTKRDGQTGVRAMAPLAVGAAGVALMMAGSAGFYLWRGNPGIGDHPAAQLPPAPQAKAELQQAVTALQKDVTDIDAWITMADAYSEMGDTQEAAKALQLATSAMPDNADLWVARGQTLVIHAGGEVTPAARYAFNRASQLNPLHPAPRYFLALSWMQAGKPEEALPVLEALKADSQPDAPWMPRVERMLTGVRTMMAAGVGGSGTPAPAPPTN
jgi:cytochrome c-type biogenesis protein CcmH